MQETTTEKPIRQQEKIKKKKKKKSSNDDDVVPGPRQSGNIQVEFTPRKLATPARESKLPEEELVCVFTPWGFYY